MTFPLGSLQVRCDHCDAGLAVEDGQRLVRLSCPVCSGNFYYLDGSMAGDCPFCEAALLALSRNRLLRYVVRPSAPAPDDAPDAKLVLLPFWHLSGILLGWDIGRRVTMEEDRNPHATSQGERPEDAMPGATRQDSGPMRSCRARVVDLNLPDPSARALGITSLRMRAAVFPLEQFSAEHEALGRVEPPRLHLQQARDALMERAIRLGDPTGGMTALDTQRLDLVCEELALYYYPFWVKSGADGGARLWDAVSGDPEALGSPVQAPEAAGHGAFDELRVLELKCGACGEALTPGNHSMVLPCSACGAFWEVTGDGLVAMEAHFARPPGGVNTEGAVWLPFWRVPVRARYGGRLAHRVADLRNMLGVMLPPFDRPRASPDSQLHYYVAAYGAMRAPRLDHAARDMTRIQPLLKRAPRARGELYHCFFSGEDARTLGYATLIQILPGVVPHRIRSLRIQAGAARLWYVPFAGHSRELVNMVTGVRYDRSAFRVVRH